MSIVFRQLFDPQSSTYSYLLADPKSRQAVLIDPVFEQVRRDVALIGELGLTLAWTLETHVHADHVTGAWLLRERLGSRIALARAGNAEGADRLLEHGDRIEFGARHLEVRATPGHTDGCITFVLDDRSMAFTGDALLIRGCGRTDFQQGDPGRLYRSIHEQVFTLPDDCTLYPGHDYRGLTATSVGEERRFNPRLGGDVGEGDFAGYMKNLGLPHPRQMDVAVPANLRCGRPPDAAAGAGAGAASGAVAQGAGASAAGSVATADWAPLNFTFAGIWEVQPHWLEEHLRDVQLVDVREPDEFAGELGHIEGARLIPLGALVARADELARERPVVAVCRSGARSAQATVLLQKAGFERVANLSGGMLRWRNMHPTAG
jgi:sulfur dioxygenase